MTPGTHNPRPEEQLRVLASASGGGHPGPRPLWAGHSAEPQMEPARLRTQDPQPRVASVRVQELHWPGRHNPRPRSHGTSSSMGSQGPHLLEDFLSPSQLRSLARVDDLHAVTVLELCVDAHQNSLGNFGVHLPNLSQLKLNGSRLTSVRDLGTSLGRLQVLWLSRCGLRDLDGIGSFQALKELFVSYNNIWDLSPLCLLEQLEVLDLEGNSVDDLGQVCYLQLCPRLATLTLEGNPMCLQPAPSPSSTVHQDYDYRTEVRRLVPQLQVLDEAPAAQTSQPTTRTLIQDWLMVKEAIREGCTLDSLLPELDCPQGAAMWRLGPIRTLPEAQPQQTSPWPLSLLLPRTLLPDSLFPENLVPEDEASNLTHGASQVLCGNPTKGLRERKQQCQTWVPPEQLPLHRPVGLTVSTSAQRPQPADSPVLSASAPFWFRTQKELCLRHLESLKEGAAAPWGPQPQPSPKEQQNEAWPPSLAPGLPLRFAKPSGASSCKLVPSPPKYRMPLNSGTGSWGITEQQFRGRRLRSLGLPAPPPLLSISHYPQACLQQGKGPLCGYVAWALVSAELAVAWSRGSLMVTSRVWGVRRTSSCSPAISNCPFITGA
ncbi:PREDICTED: leucine-rich repeat-containing protein 56 [Elephantulus edwardii]|uniref:leucine-rich repeat-containing protein 56 n=1 Tax=Elephantulus edwardii TaxID=28737 RepID=UPI0003F0644E|nr:PREDICTED: leucine-rich repeat-containing protein 56 [Elephantulus edwardii]